MKALAHSARRGVPVQYYDDHVRGVATAGIAHATRIKSHSPRWGDALCRSVRLATEFHDLGKLDPANQEVLAKKDSGEALPVKHWDTGVGWLMREGDQHDLAAAIAVYSHHTGLPSFTVEAERQNQAFRLEVPRGAGGPATFDFNETHLEKFLQQHRTETAPLALPPVSTVVQPSTNYSALFHRMVLSCLVDADHSDTARHESGEVVSEGLPLRAGDRLKALQRYVGKLAKGKSDDRTRIRELVFHEALRAPVTPSMLACDSPVGTGKTTAVMAHLLKVAVEKKLRRIFVVLPYTNIINQSVKTYRCALTLRNEKSDGIVAAHHHRAEFDHLEARQYAFLWHAPIVVTTAVQFFETLAAARTAGLRKLHQLPGSAIFIDESHAALPAKLWPQAWLWLRELTEEWGCHCVLASGSLYEFWKLPEFVSPPAELPPLLPDSCRQHAGQAESERVTYQPMAEPLVLARIPEIIEKMDGPRLMIVNTVQSAAVIADHLASKLGRSRCEHISTALTPCDREATYRRIQARLEDEDDNDWILVATSCVEAGVDFDFASGLRERAGLVNLLQASGRVNRKARVKHALVYDFVLAPDPLLTIHPGFADAATVLEELFAQRKVAPEFCLDALRKEMQRLDPTEPIANLKKHEAGRDFPEVQKLFRVIEGDTITVVVDKKLRERVEAFERVGFRELQSGSVQMWRKKGSKLAVFEFPQLPGLYCWTLGYDTFLGYMAGVLPLLKAGQSGFEIL
ncbi:MAG: CRISPR-associated endonuclease Cas3'' [Limisphaerales bacterium]